MTPCPTIKTRTITGTITVTSTKTPGQKTTTPIPLSSFTTPSTTPTSTSTCTVAQTLTNYVPPYASACNANDFGSACSCWGVQQATTTLKWKTQTQTVTTYAKTKILTVTMTPSGTTKTTTSVVSILRRSNPYANHVLIDFAKYNYHQSIYYDGDDNYKSRINTRWMPH